MIHSATAKLADKVALSVLGPVVLPFLKIYKVLVLERWYPGLSKMTTSTPISRKNLTNVAMVSMLYPIGEGQTTRFLKLGGVLD